MKVLLFGLLLAVITFAQFENPPFIPIWQGREPIRYCIASEMEPLRAEIVDAVALWMGAAGLPFYETRNCFENRTIAFRLGFNGGKLGCALYPPPLFAEPGAGDVYLDYGVPWWIPSVKPYLRTVLRHEVGHAMGMGESMDTDDLMHPGMITPDRTLSTRERKTLACLYQGLCY